MFSEDVRGGLSSPGVMVDQLVGQHRLMLQCTGFEFTPRTLSPFFRSTDSLCLSVLNCPLQTTLYLLNEKRAFVFSSAHTQAGV